MNACPVELDLTISCLRIDDPDRARSRHTEDGDDLGFHPGYHDVTLARVFAHAEFLVLLGEVKAWVAQLSSAQKEARLGIFCRAGRHRSVAVLWLLAHVLARLGARVRVNHLEQNAGRWSHLCRGCRSCAEGTMTKQRLAAEVMRAYMSLEV